VKEHKPSGASLLLSDYLLGRVITLLTSRVQQDRSAGGLGSEEIPKLIVVEGGVHDVLTSTAPDGQVLLSLALDRNYGVSAGVEPIKNALKVHR